jgi:hypothetical protein
MYNIESIRIPIQHYMATSTSNDLKYSEEQVIRYLLFNYSNIEGQNRQYIIGQTDRRVDNTPIIIHK